MTARLGPSPLGPWHLLRSEPGAHAGPGTLPQDGDWVDAAVPGTVGAALLAAGRWKPDDAVAFDAADWWYRVEIKGEGPVVLRLDGLATIAEVFVDDARVLASDNMFLAHEIEVVLSGRHAIAIAFRSLDAYLAGRKGRARWRPRLVRPPSLRFVRTLLLGHIPGWGPPVHAVGPWRAITVEPAEALRVAERRLSARFDRDGEGLLDVALRLSRKVEGWVTARCGDIDFVLVDEAGDGWLRGRVEVPDVRRWWPHTHGDPVLYDVSVVADGTTFDIGSVGFRTIAVDRDVDGKGFGLVVNGVPIFARGACWTSADVVALPCSREACRPLLEMARDAGMNMIRVGGTMGYEADGFYRLCDELGLMVWQDFAFSNFDYPAGDETFRASVEAEARQFLVRTQSSPSLCVLCGASEVAQQAAMLGMPAPLWSNALFDAVLPDACAALRPDVPFTPHSPWGGALPFQADEGVSHYYGVSAHRRPIEEARRAHVRFSAESLGFANVPDGPVALEPDAPATVQPNFTERFAHDVGALWAFEGIRNHYTEALYGVDVAALRRENPERFLDLARATSAEVMEATFAEWRREGSATRGALVWFLRDLFPGAGWGVIDVGGAPKAAYHGLKRAFRSCGLVLTDENLNGLKITLFNEAAAERAVTLTLACLRDGETPVMQAAIDIVLPPRTTIGLAATTVWGGFFDTTNAFRFGEPSHDVTLARLTDTATSAFVADAFHFPLGRGHARRDLGSTATFVAEGGRWHLDLATRRFAQSVRIDLPGWRADEDWLHLAPGFPRRIALRRQADGSSRPNGTIRPLNGAPVPVLPSGNP